MRIWPQPAGASVSSCPGGCRSHSPAATAATTIRRAKQPCASSKHRGNVRTSSSRCTHVTGHAPRPCAESSQHYLARVSCPVGQLWGQLPAVAQITAAPVTADDRSSLAGSPAPIPLPPPPPPALHPHPYPAPPARSPTITLWEGC